MTKFDVLFFSDLHLHERKEFSRITESGMNSRLEEGKSILDQILKIAYTYETPHIVCLGDIFEFKDRIPAHVLFIFKNFLDKCEGSIHFHLLKGTHDYNLWDYPILANLDRYDRFHFYVEPCLDYIGNEKIYFIPAYKNYEDFRKIFNNAPNEATMVCCHQEIPGVMYQSGKVVEGKQDLNYKPGVAYLSGHIHNPQQVCFTYYLGAPYEVEFGEIGERYVYLYDSSSKKMEKIQLNYPLFIDINITEMVRMPIEGNYVRVIGEMEESDYKLLDKKKLKEQLELEGAKGVTFNLKVNRQKQTRISEGIITDKEILKLYCEENKGNLNEKELLRIGQELCEEI